MQKILSQIIYHRTLIFLFITMGVACQLSDDPKNKIIIEGYIVPGFKGDLPKDADAKNRIRIQYASLYSVGTAQVNVIEQNVDTGKMRWEIISGEDLVLSPQIGLTFIVHPGDSIHIYYSNNKIVYSGKNTDSVKFSFINQLVDFDSRIVKPTKNSFTINSLQDYLNWNKYVDDKLSLQIDLIDDCKNKIPASEYEYYKAQIISSAEKDRVNAFGALQTYANKDSLSGLTFLDLNAIWDSTQYKQWAKWVRGLSNYVGSIQDIYSFNRMEVRRSFNFDFTNDSLNAKNTRTYLNYTHAKEKYKGLLRERLMAFILDEQTITEMGLKNPMTQKMLKDYYSQPGFPEYKQWVKELEEKAKKLAKN